MKKQLISFILAVAFTLLAGVSASAQGPAYFTVTQVDTSHFPQIDVYISVTDAAGNPVRNVDPSALRLTENGQQMQLVRATRAGEQGPVNTVLVIDRTGSMAFANKMAGAKQAAATYVDQMRPGDKTALIQFDTEIDTLQSLTDDKTALLTAISKIYPRGNTSLYDAIARAGQYFENVQGRKAVIVVTDGMDNSSKLNRDTLIQQLSTANYSVYTVGLGAKGAGYGSQDGIDETVLQDIASATSAAYAYAPDASQLNSLYQQLSSKLQNEYRLTFVTPIPLRDGVKRNIVVTAPGAGSTQTAYNPGGVIPEVAPQWESWLLFVVALVLLMGLFLAPAGLRLAREGGLQMPQLPLPQKAKPSRIKLTSGAPAPMAAGSAPATRPSRVKIIRRAPGSPGSQGSQGSPNRAQTQMPWDEGTPKH